MLAIVFISDEDDCSAEVPELFEPSGSAFPGPLNRRCWDYPEALYPLDRYEEGLLAEREANRLAILGIVGIPFDAEGLSYGEILSLDDMQVREDPEGTGFIAPSCGAGVDRQAFPPIRFVELAARLESVGTHTRLSSICSDSYEEPLNSFAFEVMDLMATCP